MRDDQATNAQAPEPATSAATGLSGPPEPSESPESPDRWHTSLAVPLVIVLLAAGVIAALVLVSRQEQDSGAALLASGRVDGADLPVTVPYREIAGAIVVDVELGEGGRTVPMILDTGAPTIVSESTARAYGGAVAGTVTTVSADGQVLSSDVVPLPPISIGDAVFGDVGAVVAVIEPGNPFYCITQSGFIGANLMRTAVWQIDPRSRHLTIAQSIDALDHIDGATRLQLTPASDISPSPLVDLAVGEGTPTFLLDTGSNGWLALNPRDLEQVSAELPDDPPTVAILGTGAAGAFTTRARWLAAGTDAEPLLLATSETLPEGQGNAGTDYLWRFVVTIDWPGGSVYLDPVAELLPSVPPSAALAWDEGFVVGSYVEGLDANAGLTLGADISSLDGRDVTQVPFDDFCMRLVDALPAFEMTVAGDAPDGRPSEALGDVPMTVEVAPVEDFFARLEE